MSKLSPQVRASIKLAIPLLVAATVPILVGTLADIAATTSGSTSALAVLGVRVLQGYLDQKREERGQVNEADVGAYLPPKGSAPAEALRRSRFRDTTDVPVVSYDTFEDIPDELGLEIENELTSDPLGRGHPQRIITGLVNPSPIVGGNELVFPQGTVRLDDRPLG